jgi:transposase
LVARQNWRIKQREWNPQRLVFLDETGLNTKMTRLYGRSPVGERCHAAAPHGHWQSATFIAALRHDGLSAPWLLDGPMDGDMFLTYVRQVLGPELRPGDLVICDNLGSHKVSGVEAAITACGAELLYLPAYSPDLNPIEMAFSKLKALLRQAAARTWDQLLQAIAEALNSFSPQQCSNFLRHAHYAAD